MKIKVIRYFQDEFATSGVILLDGEFMGHVLEDPFHEVKIPNETRIPAGTYEVEFRQLGQGSMNDRYVDKFGSNHHGMLELQDVPGFTFVYIHIGNFVADTSGCLLIGSDVMHQDNEANAITSSTSAYKPFYKAVSHALIDDTPVDIEIVDMYS